MIRTDDKTGDVITDQPDGTTVRRDGKTGEIISTTKPGPDGTTIEMSRTGEIIGTISYDDSGNKVTERPPPDGSTLTEKTDGTWYITFKGGKTYHSDGTCKDAAGNTIPC